jgi:Zn-finger nucleic acid-binding protein
MEQVSINGTEIDRCSRCHGIWFDAGEVDVLSNKESAAAIDIGSAREGKRYNLVDHYHCPRCGGEMIQRVDSQQTHIHYETCSECDGSFFDAGEFLDLSQLTLSDYIKRLIPGGHH